MYGKSSGMCLLRFPLRCTIQVHFTPKLDVEASRPVQYHRIKDLDKVR